jgi:hypothetical protein
LHTIIADFDNTVPTAGVMQTEQQGPGSTCLAIHLRPVDVAETMLTLVSINVKSKGFNRGCLRSVACMRSG